MNNVRKNIWNFRIHPLIGVFFLVFSLGTIGWLTGNTVLFGAKAAIDDTPKNVQISNITDTSFTVSYKTDEKAIGSLAYGTTAEFGSVAFDEREASGSATEHWVHSFTLTGLTPATKYFFSIASGNDTFLNGDSPYEVTTAPAGALTPTAQEPLVGTIQTPNGGIPTEAVIYVSTTDGQLLSALLKVDGTYNIPLNTLRKKDLASLLPLTEDTPLLLNIEDATMQSKAYVLSGQTNPVPLIILSKEYNFSINSDPLPTVSSSDSATITPPAFPSTADPGPAEPKIISPEQDQEFKDAQPVFKGKAVPNTIVSISIHSDAQIETTVKADDNGNWEYRPDAPLDPGDHTITIETPDSAGFMQTITQQFTVFAEGSQFVEPSVSPSAPTATPTKPTVETPTPTPTTAAPTQQATPTTAQATVAPTASPSPSAIITQPPIPQSGSSAMLIGVIATIFILGVGALFIAL